MLATERTGLLVVSCDKYSDLWRPFFELFRRFWPSCPLRTYLLSNTIGSDLPGVSNVLVGPDRSWSDSLQRALKQLEHEYVFMFLDDLFLRGPVKQDEVLKVLQWTVESGANYVRLSRSPKPDRPHNGMVGLVAPGAIYRASGVLSVWRRTVLLELLVPGENAWDFEVFGSVRSDQYEGFYATWEAYVPVINGVIKGKWCRRALRTLRALGVEPDLTRRPVMTLAETAAERLRKVRHGLFYQLVPSRHRRRVKHALLRGEYSYHSLAP